MKNPYTILEKPILSEKSIRLSEQEKIRQYVFKVDLKANKKEIKKAVEDAFGVHVSKVTTMHVKGKPRRLRSSQFGFRSEWKKAYVVLKEGETINLI
ncbi:50S ribosomal protein L23 [Candidatus Sumerlaeota bacterium]|nr:50S ribosomal protein L23 [Candidatus Sumerlaeota bacterium]